MTSKKQWRAIGADVLVLLVLTLFLLPGLVQTVFVDWTEDFHEPLPGHVAGHLEFVERHLSEDFDFCFWGASANQW